jgi:hypothetical protein
LRVTGLAEQRHIEFLISTFMRIRPYHEHDLADLRRIHAAQGFSYPFPDLANPLFMTKLVLAKENPGRELRADGTSSLGAQTGLEPANSPAGRVLGAALLRLTAEAYLLLDPHAGTPRDRWQWLLALQAATESEAIRRGLEDAHAWLPPQIAAKFGKRLTRLGWLRDDTWTPYCKRFA